MIHKEKTADASKEKSLPFLKRFENSTVMLILIGFIVIIVSIQFISGAMEGIIALPTFITPNNVFNIFMQVSVAGILAVGMTKVMVTGGIDLSVGMLLSLVTIFMAKCVTDWGLGIPEALFLGLLVSVFLETVLGFIISRTDVEPFIITLGGMITFQGVALLLCGSREVRLLKGEFDFLKTNLISGARYNGLNLVIPVYVIIFIVAAAVIWALMKFTQYGRRMYAVGCNANAAFLSGVDVKNMRMSAYTLNGILVFLASCAQNSRLGVATITGGQGLEIDAIAAAVIGGVVMSGGKGNAGGAFIGAILLGAIGNSMSMLKLPGEWQYMVKGIVIIISVVAGAKSGIFKGRFKGKFIRRKQEMAIPTSMGKEL